MAVLYVASLLGLLAAIGVFTTVWSAVPKGPSNADVVEGRLRVYETGLPLTLGELELRQPFIDRVVRPLLKRLGHLLEQTMPEKVRQQIHTDLIVAGRPGGMSASDFIAVRYVLAGLLAVLGILIGLIAQSGVILAVA